MNQLLTSLTASTDFGVLIKDWLLLMSLCSIRVYAAFLLIPATSDQTLQGGVRNGLCLMLGLYVAGGQSLEWVGQLGASAFLALLVKESLIGVVIGFCASIVFWVAEGAGAMIDNIAGFNNVQQTNPMNSQESTPVSNLMSQLAIAGFYMLGGMVVLVGLLFESYAWWPLKEIAPQWSHLLETFARLQVSHYLESVAKLAAPILLVLVLIDLGFGIIGKTADKLEPASLAHPVKGAVAITMLSLLVALFFEQARPALSMNTLGQEIRRWVQTDPPP